MTDEIESRLPLLNCLNILEYTCWLLNSDFKRWLIIIFNNFWAPKIHIQKFSKLNGENITLRHLLKSQKFWNGKVLYTWYHGNHYNTVDVCVVLLILLLQTFDEIIDDMGSIHQQISKVCTRTANDEVISLAVLFFM